MACSSSRSASLGEQTGSVDFISNFTIPGSDSSFLLYSINANKDPNHQQQKQAGLIGLKSMTGGSHPTSLRRVTANEGYVSGNATGGIASARRFRGQYLLLINSFAWGDFFDRNLC